MAGRRITFPGADGQLLAARIDAPPGPPRAWALLAHCFTCGKDLRPLARIAQALAAEGIAVLRFDFTGLGESEGDFAGTDFSSNLDDLVAAADYLRREHAAPQLLVGHSLGGCAVLGAAHRIPEVRAVATIGAPSEPSHLLATLRGAHDEIAERGQAEVLLAGRRFTVRRDLLEDLAEQKVAACVENLGKPLLVFHSPVDGVVGVDHARRIFEAARHPKSFVSLDDADHLLLANPDDAAMVGHVLAAWAARYVDPAPPPEVRGIEGLVTVLGGAAGLTHQVIARDHRLLADEPVAVGGTDAGPTPYEYLLAGLGACTAMTLRLYADRKQWPLEGVRVHLSHDHVHAEDCAGCEGTPKKLDRIDRRLEIAGPLDAEQRQRLAEMADRCPVHRTLTGTIEVRTVLEEAADAARGPSPGSLAAD
jgi:uncharacterized OsmC-like protein/alpha-beta hydrolase superfamily lysophospholipase